LAGMDLVPPVLKDIMLWFQPMTSKRTVKGVVEELRDIILVTVCLKLVTFKFKNTSRVQSLLSLWKMPSTFRLYGR
ncbi:hypothetical protein Tco_0100495, partial [Tanacetum coccineum]